MADFWKNIWKSFRPSNYRELTALPAKNAYRHFWLINIAAVVILLIIALAMIPFLGSFVDDKMHEFKTFTIDADVQADQRIEFHKFPTFAFDMNKTDIGNEMILVTNESLFFKTTCGIVFKSDWQKLTNLKEDSSRLMEMLIPFILLMIPGLMIAILIIDLILTFVLAHIASFIIWIIARLSGHDIRFTQVLKIAFYSLGVFFLIWIILFYWLFIWWIPLIAYIAFLIAAVSMTGEKKERHKIFKGIKRRRKEDDMFKGYKLIK